MLRSLPCHSIRVLILVLTAMIYTSSLSAEPPRQLTHRDSVFISHLRRRMDLGLEYMAPYDPSRQIRTVFLNAYPSIQFFERVHLSIGVGISATYAWGNII